jgi:hypothetical protein
MPDIRKTHFPGLFQHGINNFLDPVPDINDRGPSRGIEVSLPLAVVQVNPFPPVDHRKDFSPIAMKNMVYPLGHDFSPCS